jgi:hypothetical protein
MSGFVHPSRPRRPGRLKPYLDIGESAARPKRAHSVGESWQLNITNRSNMGFSPFKSLRRYPAILMMKSQLLRPSGNDVVQLSPSGARRLPAEGSPPSR